MNKEIYDAHYLHILQKYKPTVFSTPENIAVCIETRFLPIMYIIVLQMQRFLPSNWKMLLYASKEVIEQYKEMFKDCSIEIKLLEYEITNVSTYNKYMMTEDFWKPFIEYNRVLIFQSDTMMYRYGIEKFMKYDYVGAPWPHNIKLDVLVGNGGFSLRNPRASIECLQNINKINIPKYLNHEIQLANLDNIYPEDVFYSQGMNLLGYNVCHYQLAQYFSIESVKYNIQSIGSHRINHFAPSLYKMIYQNSVIPYNVTYRNPNISGHRFGWKFVYENMQTVFNNPTGVKLNTWMDCDYNSNYKNKEGFPWVGISHLTPVKSLDYFKYCDINLLLSNNDFIHDLKTCLGIFTLSHYMKVKVEEMLNILGFEHIKVCNLYHPVYFIEPSFSISNIKNINTLVSIGCQLRRMTTIFKIKTSYTKVWLPGKDIREVKEHLLDECNTYNISITQDEINSVNIRMLNNEDYDKLLLNSFILIDLYEGSANNALIECISRNIPCFVRRLPAVEEYIGKDYPLLFDSIEQLEQLLNSRTKIKNAYRYLVEHTEFKEQIKMDRFISDILNSEITKYILSH